MRARMPGVSRDAVDRAAVDGVPLIEVPGAHARPPMLVPRDDMALALRLQRMAYERHIGASVKSGDFDRGEIRQLAGAIVGALEEGPLPSADLRRVIGSADGTPLTGALLDLALRGIIRRFPAEARIDSPKYQYELLHPDDRPDVDGAGDAARVEAAVAERFLRWYAPATLDELCEWAGFTKKAGRAALEAIEAESIAVSGWTSEAWLTREDAAAWRTFTPSRDDRAVLLPYRDALVAVRRPLRVLSDTPAASVLDRRMKPSRLSAESTLRHHSILYDGELVGVWEYDADEEAVVTRVWSRNRRIQRRVADAADDTSQFIRKQLGDAKLAAIDPAAARARRLAFCRTKPRG
jgi:hypothetical protein